MTTTEKQVKGTKPVRQMIETASKDVMVQPRTMGLARPKWFYFEPAANRRDADKGNEANQIEVGVHQVDPTRPPSCVAVMPDLELLAETGNPYPAEVQEDGPIVTSKRWLQYVPLAHAAFEVLKAKGEGVTAAQLVEEAVTLAGVGYKKDGGISSNSNYVITDMLRDLRCYGIATSVDAGKEFKKTVFSLVEGYQTAVDIAKKGKGKPALSS